MSNIRLATLAPFLVAFLSFPAMAQDAQQPGCSEREIATALLSSDDEEVIWRCADQLSADREQVTSLLRQTAGQTDNPRVVLALSYMGADLNAQTDAGTILDMR
jgi:hypothetical protein